MSEQVKLTGDPKLDALLKEPSPEFDALVRSLPETYWARYDLGAMRLGWEFGRMHKDALERVDMVLHCPECREQHIDAPEPDIPGRVIRDGKAVSVSCVIKANDPRAWTNPPHRSHLCHKCGHVWRPADFPTNGVASVATKGKNDSPIAATRVAADFVDVAKVREVSKMLFELAARDMSSQTHWDILSAVEKLDAALGWK